jgi:hypothetical protein
MYQICFKNASSETDFFFNASSICGKRSKGHEEKMERKSQGQVSEESVLEMLCFFKEAAEVLSCP